MQKYCAEFFGTFWLVLGGIVAGGKMPGRGDHIKKGVCLFTGKPWIYGNILQDPGGHRGDKNHIEQGHYPDH